MWVCERWSNLRVLFRLCSFESECVLWNQLHLVHLDGLVERVHHRFKFNHVRTCSSFHVYFNQTNKQGKVNKKKRKRIKNSILSSSSHLFHFSLSPFSFLHLLSFSLSFTPLFLFFLLLSHPPPSRHVLAALTRSAAASRTARDVLCGSADTDERSSETTLCADATRLDWSHSAMQRRIFWRSDVWVMRMGIHW